MTFHKIKFEHLANPQLMIDSFGPEGKYKNFMVYINECYDDSLGKHFLACFKVNINDEYQKWTKENEGIWSWEESSLEDAKFVTQTIMDYLIKNNKSFEYEMNW